MHTLLEYDGKLPVYVNITKGSVADNKGAENIPLEKGAVIVADRFYNDFPMLSIWDSKRCFLVIRHKENLKFETLQERELPPKRSSKHPKRRRNSTLKSFIQRKISKKLRRWLFGIMKTSKPLK